MFRVCLVLISARFLLSYCGSFIQQEPLGIKLCRLLCFKTQHCHWYLLDVTQLNCILSDTILQHDKTTFAFEMDTMKKCEMSGKLQQRRADSGKVSPLRHVNVFPSLPDAEGTSSRYCNYLQGLNPVLDTLSVNNVLPSVASPTKIPASKQIMTSKRRFENLKGGRFLVTFKKPRSYFFHMLVKLENMSSGRLAGSFGVCTRSTMDTTSLMKLQNSTWGFSVYVTHRSIYIRRLNEKNPVRVGKSAKMKTIIFGILVDMNQGRLLVTDRYVKKVLLVVPGLSISESLIPIAEIMPVKTGRSIAIREHKLTLSEEEVTNRLTELGYDRSLCKGKRNFTALIQQANETYPGEIEYSAFLFIPSLVHRDCSLHNGMWLQNKANSIGPLAGLSTRSEQFRLEELQGAVGSAYFRDPSVYFWTMSLNLRRKRGTRFTPFFVINIGVILEGSLHTAAIEKSPNAWGFTLQVGPQRAHPRPFGEQMFSKKSLRSHGAMVVVLDKIRGQLFLLDPLKNILVSKVVGVDVTSCLRPVVEFQNIHHSAWTLRIKPNEEGEVLFSVAKVRELIKTR